jgi:hypothetical protein
VLDDQAQRLLGALTAVRPGRVGGEEAVGDVVHHAGVLGGEELLVASPDGVADRGRA